MSKNSIKIALALLFCLPWLVMRLSGQHHHLMTGEHAIPALVALLAGVAIVSSSFFLSWGAEAAQEDIPRALALALLALVAVLPEYAVDLYFAWNAAKDPAICHTAGAIIPSDVKCYGSYAIANMTGANRLLIGFGWSLVVILYWIKSRDKVVELEPSRNLELSFLGIVTLYSFLIPLKGRLDLSDALVLISLFILYMYMVYKADAEELDLEGVPLAVAQQPKGIRRLLCVGFFLFSATVIFMSAEPFAESLVSTGKAWNIDEFLLVQWLAPLASESPEIVVSAIFAWKLAPTSALGALVSSKVNQWALLVGAIPVAFSISLGSIGALIFDTTQKEELFLTSAQSLFAVAILANLSISVTEALILFGLFALQLCLSTVPHSHMAFSFVYIGLSVIILARDPKRIPLFFGGFIVQRFKEIRQKGKS